MHKYYEWRLVESLPLSALGELLSYAENEEKRLEKLEKEKQLFPLWLANSLVAKLKGTEEPMDFEDFINECLEKPQTQKVKPKKETKKTERKTADEILAEFAPIIEADTKRGG